MYQQDLSAARPRPWGVALLVTYATGMRVLPYVLHAAFGMKIERAYEAYPWNFSPVFALAVFGGAVLGPRLALALPLGVYVVSDLLIAAVGGPQYGFYGIGQAFTYLGLAAAAGCGLPLRNSRGFLPLACAGLAAPVAFFLVTNLAVWATGTGWYRPFTPEGLVQCLLIDAPPFFTPTLLSQLVFLPILFSPLALRPRVPVAANVSLAA
jgi:hypothetical protein